MSGRKVSVELIGALIVVLAGISGGTYFYLRGQSPVKLTCAVKDIPRGAAITADSVELTTVKRGDIPDWCKSEKDVEAVANKQDAVANKHDSETEYHGLKAAKQSYYLQTIPEVVGQKSNGIKKEQFIYRRGINAGGDSYGAYLLTHRWRP